jgi:Flp pilus assembly protein TadD
MSQDKNSFSLQTHGTSIRSLWWHILAWLPMLVSVLQGSSSLQLASALPERSPDLVQTGNDKQRAIRPNDAGLRFLREQRLEEAVAEFRQEIRADPKSASSRNNLGVALRQKGEMNLAMEQFRTALKLGPSYPEACNNLGIVFGRLHDLQAAEINLRQAIELRPTYAEVYNKLGIALTGQGRNQEGCRGPGDSASHQASLCRDESQFGPCLIRMGETVKAIPRLQKAALLEPDKGETHYQLGLALQPSAGPSHYHY